MHLKLLEGSHSWQSSIPACYEASHGEGRVERWAKDIGFPKAHICQMRNQLKLIQKDLQSDLSNNDLIIKEKFCEFELNRLRQVEEYQIRQKAVSSGLNLETQALNMKIRQANNYIGALIQPDGSIAEEELNASILAVEYNYLYN